MGELLPRAVEAFGVRYKLETYSLDFANEVGAPKARGFDLILGITLDALAVIDPGALRQGGDRGLGDLRVLIELEVLQALGEREPGVDQPAAFAALSALCDLRF